MNAELYLMAVLREAWILTIESQRCRRSRLEHQAGLCLIDIVGR